MCEKLDVNVTVVWAYTNNYTLSRGRHVPVLHSIKTVKKQAYDQTRHYRSDFDALLYLSRTSVAPYSEVRSDATLKDDGSKLRRLHVTWHQDA